MSGAVSAISVAGAAAAAEGAGTLGVLSAAAAANAGAIGLIGTGLSAFGSIQQAQAQSASAKYNSQVAANNAVALTQKANYAGEEGEIAAGKQGLTNRGELGGIKTAQAANGVDVNSGSAANVQASQAQLGQLDALTIRSNAARQAYGFQTEAANATAQSSVDASTAKNDATTGYIKAGTSLLTRESAAAAAGLGADAPVKDAFHDYNNSDSLNSNTTMI